MPGSQLGNEIDQLLDWLTMFEHLRITEQSRPEFELFHILTLGSDNLRQIEQRLQLLEVLPLLIALSRFADQLFLEDTNDI